jgi:hypothetical protein
VDNIKLDLGEICWSGVNWIGLSQDRDKWRAIEKAIMNFWVLQIVGKQSDVYKAGGFSSSAQLHKVTYLELPFQ